MIDRALARTSRTCREAIVSLSGGSTGYRLGRRIDLPADGFDDRSAIVGTAGSGKTYAGKGFVERLLESGARVAIVDPLEGRSHRTSDLFRYRFLDPGNR